MLNIFYQMGCMTCFIEQFYTPLCSTCFISKLEIQNLFYSLIIINLCWERCFAVNISAVYLKQLLLKKERTLKHEMIILQ